MLIDESWRGNRFVVEIDIANCFEAIPHEQLMRAVEERVCDQTVLQLVRTMLRAGVMENGQLRQRVTGTLRGEWFLRCWPRLRQLTARVRLWMSVEDVVAELNRFLRGSAGFFRYGNSALILGQIRNYPYPARRVLGETRRGERAGEEYEPSFGASSRGRRG